MPTLSPALRDAIADLLPRIVGVIWTGGFFVAVQAAILKLAQ